MEQSNMSNTSKTSQNKPTSTIKEVYNTQLVDKQIPTIIFSTKNVESVYDWDEITISVSDTTAEGAYNVFKKVISNIGLELDG